MMAGNEKLITCQMVANSRSASVYHIGYPIVGRSVFGMWGAFYFVGVRALLAIIWFGVQVYSGSALVANILRAIFGHKYTDIPNHIPESMGITSAGMLAFFLFWVIHIPFTFLRPYQLKWLFNLKIVTMLPAVWGLFIFCMANTKGHIGASHLNPIKNSTGGWGWFFVYSINAGMGNTATLITNQPDYARWSKTKTASMLPQLIANPVSVTLSATLGILSVRTRTKIYPMLLSTAIQLCLEKLPLLTSAVFSFRSHMHLLLTHPSRPPQSITTGASSSGTNGTSSTRSSPATGREPPASLSSSAPPAGRSPSSAPTSPRT